MIMNRFQIFLMAWLCLCLLNWPQQAHAETQVQVPDPAARALQLFIQTLTEDQKPFQIVHSEVTAARTLVAKTFDKKILARVQTVRAKEVRVQKTGEASAAHIGVLTLDYATQADAKAALRLVQGKYSGYLARTKILTRYQWQQNGVVLLLLYSETGVDEQVDAFFAAMASNPAELPRQAQPLN